MDPPEAGWKNPQKRLTLSHFLDVSDGIPTPQGSIGKLLLAW
jgi:hypothetical protein